MLILSCGMKKERNVGPKQKKKQKKKKFVGLSSHFGDGMQCVFFWCWTFNEYLRINQIRIIHRISHHDNLTNPVLQNKNIQRNSVETKLFSQKNGLNKVIFLEYFEFVEYILGIWEYNSHSMMIYELFWIQFDVIYHQNNFGRYS